MAPPWRNLLEIAARNRPRRKPQLWENLALSARRRIELEVGRRLRSGWLDEPRIVTLSSIGFGDGKPTPRLEVTPREMVNRSIFLYGTYEISETRLVQAFLRPGMTFLDVGAHIGYYSLIGASLVGETGRVFSFEPGADMRARLQANVRLNGLQNVEIHVEALAETTGETGFYPSTLASNQGISSIIAPDDSGPPPATVPSLSLDDFAARLNGRIDLLKMDIEGAELQVVRGGQRTLADRHAPPLIFEAHRLEPLAEALGALGYKVRQLHYTLDRGLELPDISARTENLFAAYEAPNYFAAKDDSVFTEVLARANDRRSPLYRLLGRI